MKHNTMPVRGIRIPDPLWARLEQAAATASKQEGRQVSASEWLRRLIEREVSSTTNHRKG